METTKVQKLIKEMNEATQSGDIVKYQLAFLELRLLAESSDYFFTK